METHERLLEVEALIAPVLSDHGLTLVDLEWRREGHRWVLRLFVDKTGKGGEPQAGREMEPGEPKGGRPEAGREMMPGRGMKPGEPKGGGPEAGREMVSGPERVSIADCQHFSEEVGDVLDVSGLILESYDLEVSSPGLNRELKKEREFQWATGRMVRCWVSGSVGGRTEFTGHLRRVTDDLLSLEESDGQVSELPRSLVTKARLELDFPWRH
jgi:ribosome maturation factor RimP